MKLILTLAISLGIQSTISANENNFFKNTTLIPNCKNYPYEMGIDFNLGRDNSFKILSTSVVEVLDESLESILIAFEESKLKAKVNISNFLKLYINPMNNLNNGKNYSIRINGKIIQETYKLTNRQGNSTQKTSFDMKGIKELDYCYKKGKYVLTTLEVTDETIRIAEELGNYMKRK